MNITTLKKKIESVWYSTLLKKEQKYVWDWYRDRADYLAQLYPKVLAFHSKKNVKCECCDRVMTDIKEANWSHRIPRGNYWSRWQEWNIYCCTEYCNAWDKENHHNRLTMFMINKYWKKKVENWLIESNKIHKKPTYEEIKEVVEKYEKLLEWYL